MQQREETLRLMWRFRVGREGTGGGEESIEELGWHVACVHGEATVPFVLSGWTEG